MHSQGMKGREPVLGEGEFFTAETPAPAMGPHRRKHGVRTSRRRLHHLFSILTGPLAYFEVPFHNMSFKRLSLFCSKKMIAAIT
jgi:hypothetical protein